MSYSPFFRCRWLRSSNRWTPSMVGAGEGFADAVLPEQPLSTSRAAAASKAPRGPESTRTSLVWPGESPSRPDGGAAGSGLQQRVRVGGQDGLPLALALAVAVAVRLRISVR